MLQVNSYQQRTNQPTFTSLPRSAQEKLNLALVNRSTSIDGYNILACKSAGFVDALTFVQDLLKRGLKTATERSAINKELRTARESLKSASKAREIVLVCHADGKIEGLTFAKKLYQDATARQKRLAAKSKV